MKNFKRIIALILLLIFVFTGCKNGKDGVATPENLKEQSMYALILSDSEINDNGINQYTWKGIMDLKKDSKIQTKYFEAKNEDEIKLNIEKAVSSNYDIIFSLGDLANANLEKYKTNSPDQLFAFINRSSEEKLDSNSFSIEFADCEGAFLSGYLACKVTKTGNVGFLADVSDSVSTNAKYGFYAGVHYYNVVNKKDIKAFDKVIGSKSDDSLVTSNISALYDEGCDVVFANFDFAEDDMIKVAKEKNGKIIGIGYVNNTESKETVIAKSIKHIDKGIKNISDLYRKNEKLGGTSFVYGLKDGCIAFEYDKTQVPLETIDIVDIVKQKIISGEIDVPRGEAEYQNYIQGSKDATNESTVEITSDISDE